MKAISLLFFLLVSCAHKPEKTDPILGPLHARYQSIRKCYLESELYLGRFSTPQGHVTVDFLISDQGKVIEEKITENTFPKNRNFEACVLDQIRVINFPEVKEQTRVVHPINFLPVEE